MERTEEWERRDRWELSASFGITNRTRICTVGVTVVVIIFYVT